MARAKIKKPTLPPPAAPLIPKTAGKVAPYFVLVLAVLVAYGNTYDNAFIYDDESLILKNAFLQSWHSLGAIFTTSITAGANVPGGFYRPLQILLYLIVYQLTGPSTFAYHFLNIGLHAANSCLVYLLGRKLRFRPWPVFLGALLWALHPVHTEIITYISGTADPLYVFFSLIGVIALVPRFTREGFIIAGAMMILALLSKEEAVCFPLLVMACIFFLDKERLRPQTYYRTWPFWAIAITYVILHKLCLSFSDFDLHKEHDLYASSVLCRIYTFLAALPHYFGFLVWPVNLHFDRNFPAVTSPWHLSVLAGLIMVLAAGTQIALGRKHRSLALSWGLLWFAAADVLHTGILVPVNAVLLEHWLYLPSVGLFLGVSQAVASTRIKFEQRKPAEISIAISAAIVLGWMTYQQNTIWRDPVTLYLNIFKNGEPSPHAHNNLAIEYTLEKKYPEALEQYDLAIELSGDTNAQAHHNLAITLLNGPNGNEYTQEAIKNLKRALEIDPDYYPSSNALAALYEQLGDKDQAAFYRQQVDATHRKLTGQPASP